MIESCRCGYTHDARSSCGTGWTHSGLKKNKHSGVELKPEVRKGNITDTLIAQTKLILQLNAKIEAQEKALEVAREVIDFYSHRREWHLIEANSNIGSYIQDGDLCFVFEKGEDCPWMFAEEALEKIQQILNCGEEK